MGMESPGIPGGDAMGMESLSTERLQAIANSPNVSPFRRRMAQALLRVRAEGHRTPPVLTTAERENLSASISGV